MNFTYIFWQKILNLPFLLWDDTSLNDLELGGKEVLQQADNSLLVEPRKYKYNGDDTILLFGFKYLFSIQLESEMKFVLECWKIFWMNNGQSFEVQKMPKKLKR